MKRLVDIYEKFLPGCMNEKLRDTHSEYFLSVLCEYDENICDLFYYATITYKEKYLLVGTEYDYTALEMSNSEAAKLYYATLIHDGIKKCSITDLYRLGNAENSENLYIPIYLDEQKLACVCSNEKKKVLEYLKLDDGIEIYEKYPLLINILKWGIFYILPKEGEERLYDHYVAEIEKSKKGIKERNVITNSVFEKMHLPYLSTIHSIAGWNYEGKANNGYIDLLKPFSCINNKKKLEISFEENFLLDAYKARTIRKFVELSDEYLHLKVESSYGYIFGAPTEDAYWNIIGLGEPEEKVFATVCFEGYGKWKLDLENESISYDGSTYKFKSRREREPYYKIVTRDFWKDLKQSDYEYDEQVVDRLNLLIELASSQKHGTMVIFSEKAKEESERLCKCGRGIKIKPLDFSKLTEKDMSVAYKVMYNMSKIDGALFLDFQGVCYSIGTIVDGRACENSNPGRGARYNSAYTYINDCNEREIICYCAVISEDETVDVFGSFGKERMKEIYNKLKEIRECTNEDTIEHNDAE